MQATGRIASTGIDAVKAERRRFAWLAVAILVMALIGFTRTYLLVPWLGMPRDTPGYSWLIHLHAAVFFGWLLFFVLQSFWVGSGQIQRHRQFGAAGLLLYVGLVVTGPLVAVHSVHRYGGTPNDLSFLAVSLGNVLAYALIIGAGFVYRRRPAVHKRLMVIGMVPLLTAPFGRLGDYPLMLQHVLGPGLVLVALAVIDWRGQGRVHLLTRTLGPAVLAWELLPNLYMHTDAWRSLARALAG